MHRPHRIRRGRPHLVWWPALFAPAAECRTCGHLIGAKSLDESWEKLPPPEQVNQQLEGWGVMDAALGQAALNDRWVQFSGVSFGVAPADCWPELRCSLLEVERCLAIRQQDMGYV